MLLTQALEELEKYILEVVENARKEIRDSVMRLKRKRVFVCMDRGTVHQRQTKSCSNGVYASIYDAVKMLEEHRVGHLKKLITVLSKLRKLLEHTKIEVEMVAPSSMTIHLKNGRLLFVGDNVVLVINRDTEELRALRDALFRLEHDMRVSVVYEYTGASRTCVAETAWPSRSSSLC